MNEQGEVHRRAAIRELCAECSEPTETKCLRCGKPLCGTHRPSPDQRCGACEALWIERANVLQRRAPLRPTTLGAAALLGLLVAGLLLGENSLVTGFFGYIVAACVLLAPFLLSDGNDRAPWWLRRHRRRFLAERKQHSLVAATARPKSD